MHFNERLEAIHAATAYISQKIGGRKPVVGIILGSGLGNLVSQIQNQTSIPYSEIPYFPKDTVAGHKGNLIIGTLSGKCVVAMQGRFHYYQGYDMYQVTLPVRVMVRLGIENLFVSNAAGGVCFDYSVGTLMVIRDHINKLPNPLIGPNLDEFGPRFPDMTRPYDPRLINLATQISKENGISLAYGTYLASTGPSFETPAEYKYFRMIGADAVGMSTIPEVIVARHSSIPVFGISVITNEAHDDYAPDFENNGDDVIKAADAAASRMTFLFSEMIKRL